MTSIEVGRCSRCNDVAERGPSGAWWHREGGETCNRLGPGIVKFKPLSDAAMARIDWYRWCRDCDVKWYGEPECWLCGAITGSAFSRPMPEEGHIERGTT